LVEPIELRFDRASSRAVFLGSGGIVLMSTDIDETQRLNHQRQHQT
jgi:hypothetical protein